MADDLTELDHYTQLRAWAAGVYPVEAAVELLIRTGRARTTDAWIKPFDPDQGGSQAGHWVDFDTIPDHLNGLSNGEQRVLRIAAALGGDTATVNLNDALTTLDRHTADLVLAAISHAAGTHQGVLTSTDQDGRLTATDVPGPLYPWPDTR